MATRRREPQKQQASPMPLGHKDARKEAGEYVERYDEGLNRAGMVPAPGIPDHVKGDDGDRQDTRRRIYLGKQRLGKRWSEIVLAVEDGVFTWDEFVATLDSSEIARGQLKDKTGKFRGRPPSLVPRGFFDACVAEMMKRGKEEYQKAYVDAIKALTDIATGETLGAKPADRIKAAVFVIERLEGKTPQAVEIRMSDPFQDMVAGAVASVEEEKAIANAQDYMERMQADESTNTG